MLPRLRQRLLPITWLTLVMLVVATLAPGVSRALAYATGDAQIAGAHCLAVAAPEADRAPGKAPTVKLDHCPLCVVRGDSPAPPPVVVAVPDGQGLRHAAPAAVVQTPRFVLVWRGGQPRAPPTLA